jgi:hypothetical protein
MFESKGEKVAVREGRGGSLQIELTEFGRDFINTVGKRKVERVGVGNMFSPEGWDVEGFEFEVPDQFILAALLEDVAGIELLNPNSDDYVRIGVLTDSPIIAEGVRRDERGEIEEIGKVWWYPNYQIESEIEEIAKAGVVEFTGEVAV